MKRRLSLRAIFTNILLAFLIATVISLFLGPNIALAIGATIFLLGTGPQLILGKYKAAHPPLAFAGIQTEVWVRDVTENLYPKNSFLRQSIDDSEYLKNRTVHLPQSGAASNVEKNRSSLPATAAKRVDTIVSYDVDEFTSDPRLIQLTEELEASYDKRQSIIRDDQNAIIASIAGNIIYNWAPSAAAAMVATSGSSRSALGTGQTGNRKAIAIKDIKELRRLLNNQDVPEEGRILLIDGNLETDLFGISEFVSWDKMGNTPLVNGAIGRILGFNVFLRSSVIRYDNSGTPVKKAYGSANASTDNLGAIAWHPQFVRLAMGNGDGSNGTNGGVQIFFDEKSPLYYGDTLSMLMRGGGRQRYSDGTGVVALIEAAA